MVEKGKKLFYRLFVSMVYLLKRVSALPIEILRNANSARYLEISNKYPRYIREGNAISFCLYHAQTYCKGKGVDVGPGVWPFPSARPVELSESEDACNINEEENSLDYVFSSHCLEHLDRWESALVEWRRVLAPSGILYLYLPHPAAELWNKENLVYHKWTPAPDVVIEKLKELDFNVIDNSFFPDAYLSFYVIARKK